MRPFFTLFAAGVVSVFSALGAAAQGHDWRGAMERATMVTAAFDQDYERGNQRLLPLHFSIGVPFLDGQVQTQTRAMKEGNVFEARFLTPEGIFLEYVTVSTGTVGAGDLDSKLSTIFEVIEGQIYPTLGLTGEVEVLGGRIVEIGGRPGVEWIALADLPDQGVLVARIVGVMSPNETDVAFFVQQTMRDRMGLAGPDDMALTYGGSMAGSVRFQAYRDGTGALIEF